MSPPLIYNGAIELGIKKSNSTPFQIFTLAIMAGFHIGLGSFLAVSCGANTPQIYNFNPGLTKILIGIYGFPFGLFMVVVMGSDLFTSNIGTVSLAFFEKKTTFKKLMKSWCISYIGNFCGSLLLALMVKNSGVISDSDIIINYATLKVSHPFGEAFLRGILCNWLVCTAIYMTTASDSITDKFIGLFGPISAFVSLSFDHCVANMFTLPLAIMLGANFGISTFIMKSLIPVTLGNIFGGVLPVAFMNWLSFSDIVNNKIPF
jgi:formate/nitrite transporter